MNLPSATWPPASVAVTVVPEVPLGTLKVQLKVPVIPVDNDPVLQLEIVTPSKTRATVLSTENPVPETVTVDPTAPELALRVIFGVVTVNVPVAFAPPTSVATTVVPEVPLGTLNVQANNPKLSVVNDPALQLEIVTPSKTSPTLLDREKPAPATATIAPIGPWPGTTTITGVVTRKTLVDF